MKLIDGSWSLVITGKWNRYILNPSWIGKNLFHEDQIKVEFPVNNPDLPPRYVSSDNIIFVPTTHRTNFIVQEPYSDEMLTKIGKMNRILVEILSHTPLSGIGANFGFEQDSDQFTGLDLFKFHDLDHLADNDLFPKTMEIRRQFDIDKSQLNFTIRYDEEKVTFDFNFHYNVSSSAEALEILVDNLLIENRDKALQILKNTYNLELNTGEE